MFPLIRGSSHDVPSLLMGNLTVFLRTCLVFVLVFALNTWAEDAASPEGYNTIFFRANNLYREEQYDAAIQEYEKLISAGLRSANIFYNLGNSYLRTGSRGKAILYYERALRMRPRDADIRSNLDFARTLVEGGAGGHNRSWYSRTFLFLRGFLSSGEMTLLISLLYFMAMIFLILSIPFKVQRRLFYYLAAAFFVLLIIVLPSFVSSVYESEFQKKAVIMVKETDVRFGPNDDDTVHFKLHEGAVIQVTRAQNGWYQIRRNDGRMGWLKGDVFMVI